MEDYAGWLLHAGNVDQQLLDLSVRHIQDLLALAIGPTRGFRRHRADARIARGAAEARQILSSPRTAIGAISRWRRSPPAST